MGQYQSTEEEREAPSDGSDNAKASSRRSKSKMPEGNVNDANKSSTRSAREREKLRQQNQIRKLSNVSHRNIQLLSMKTRTEHEIFADDLRNRRRSSLINLILGAPSRGPRFCDDLCSLSSHISEFGIEFFPDTHQASTSVSSVRIGSIEEGLADESRYKKRRSSLGSLVAGQILAQLRSDNPTGEVQDAKVKKVAPPGMKAKLTSKPSLASTLASIDLISSFEQHDKSGLALSSQFSRPPLFKSKQAILEGDLQGSFTDGIRSKLSKNRLNHNGRVLRRSGSELSLYSNTSASSAAHSQRSNSNVSKQSVIKSAQNETKLIIILQVCLPFILAGFGNMGAGLVLNRVAQWESFHKVPIFFVLLPPFVGMKGNIEMTLASRLSTLSNLNLLDTSYQRRRAYLTNLILIISQAIGLSTFAAIAATLCECLFSHSSPGFDDIKELVAVTSLVVLASALATSVILVMISSIIMSSSIALANLIRVNPDNLSTLIAALYGDVSCVLIYGLISDWMYSLRAKGVFIIPASILTAALVMWPILLYAAYRFKETHNIAISSIPPMLTSIMVSIGSGKLISQTLSFTTSETSD